MEDISVGQLLEPLQVYNHNEPNTYDSDQSEMKPVVKKRKASVFIYVLFLFVYDLIIKI